ncbi:MAG: response regulator [Deltaproteobacteria bacterium]|nr:response regulator [Deltaproteobacteria bacterium]
MPSNVMDRANILIVDDEMGPRESLKMILKPYFNVYTAERGGQAIEMAYQVPIDLVTLDLKMPGLPGTKVLEKIKQRDPDIEAIIITGYGSMDTAIEGLRLGAFDYISKPFDVQHILALVRRALERRAARLKLREIKSEFLANVSHELRTPLSVVIGFVSILLDQLVGKLTDEQHRALEKVYKNSEELLGLVDNVLCLTSLNSGDLPLMEKEFEVGLVAKEIAQRYAKQLEEKGIELAIQSPPGGVRTVSDPAKLSRIFHNLLQNAVKFTAKGQITVKVHRSANRGVVDLEIIDTGVGIPRDHIEGMFQPFQQLDGSMRREFSGLGLGLTVARRLTDFLGGTLEIRSQPNVGTHVLLSVPYRAATQKSEFSELRH